MKRINRHFFRCVYTHEFTMTIDQIRTTDQFNACGENSDKQKSLGK